jgi:putative inorganic carbon (hco3(-)) transporter
MKNRLPGTKQVIAAVICIIWIVLFSLSLLPGSRIETWWMIVAGPALVLIWYFFADPEIFLFLTIFIVPLSIKLDLPGGFSVSVPSEIMIVLLFGYFIINSSFIRVPDRRIFSHPIFILLLISLAWMVITSALSEMPLVSFKHTFIQILYFTVFYYLFLTRFDKPANIVKFFLLYSLGLVIPIINGGIWHSRYNFNSQASYIMPQPFFNEHTIYGAALAFVIPMLFYLAFMRNSNPFTGVRKWMLVLLFLLTLAAEYFAFSRAAWLSLLMIPFLFMILKLKLRQGFLTLGTLALLFMFLLFPDPLVDFVSRNEARSNRGNITEQIESVSNIRSDISNLERINRWKCAIRMFESRPLTGYGPGTYQFVYGRFQLKTEMTRISTYHGEKGNAHSEYLGPLAESGFPGLLIYLGLIFAVVSTATRVIYMSSDARVRNIAMVVLLSVLTFYFHTIFNAFLDTDKIGSLYYGSLAAITALDVYFFRKGG